MAALSLGTAFTPAQGALKGAGVVRREFSGTGADDSTIVAGVASSYHVVVGGRISCNGADQVDILSAANTLDTIQFPAAATAIFPKGLETNAAEALILNKVGAATTVRGWIDYVTIVDGEHVDWDAISTEQT